MVIYIFRSLA